MVGSLWVYVISKRQHIVSTKFVCIHGHFYQPPRESPWSDEVEPQESAAPYHDWNERVTAECYLPNAGSALLNTTDHRTHYVNNYEKISFNFGPTLLFWMKLNHPKLLQSIIGADVKSRLRFGGHGNAVAQAYNHIIMPLANSRDKFTEIYWGIKDFEYYFKRKPEGLWLPETAVDLESLDFMSELGIKFTVLAPSQAKRVRSLQCDEWSESLSTGTPYLQRLPSGRSMIIFFYDGAVAHGVAFDKLLTNGGVFAQRLIDSLCESKTSNQLIHIATDGESYGHHHRFGEMSLAYALQQLDHSGEVELTNYGQFIDIQPPEFEVEIHQNSSWSCVHGIERWRNNCGCNTGQGFHQEWRAPLRQALDWLRDQLAPVYESTLSQYIKDPWLARNEYINVINNRDYFDHFIQSHATRRLNHQEKMLVLKWCELQRNALLMYTSCGWFFDELSGLETVQIIRYAGRVIQLADRLTPVNYEVEFIKRLEMIPSNIDKLGNGANLYYRLIKPFII